MKEMILEALALAKKFYSEELENINHTDDELIRYYKLEADIADVTPYECGYTGWYGAICWLKDMLKFEC